MSGFLVLDSCGRRLPLGWCAEASPCPSGCRTNNSALCGYLAHLVCVPLLRGTPVRVCCSCYNSSLPWVSVQTAQDLAFGSLGRTPYVGLLKHTVTFSFRRSSQYFPTAAASRSRQQLRRSFGFPASSLVFSSFQTAEKPGLHEVTNTK